MGRPVCRPKKPPLPKGKAYRYGWNSVPSEKTNNKFFPIKKGAIKLSKIKRMLSLILAVCVIAALATAVPTFAAPKGVYTTDFNTYADIAAFKADGWSTINGYKEPTFTTGKYLSFPGGTGFKYTLSEAISTGKVNITMDVQLKEEESKLPGGTMKFVMDDDSAVDNAITFFNGSIMPLANAGEHNITKTDKKTDNWYTIVMTLDFDTNKCEFVGKIDGVETKSVTDYDLDKINNVSKELKNIKAIDFVTWGNEAPYEIRSLKIEIPDKSYTAFEDDFSSGILSGYTLWNSKDNVSGAVASVIDFSTVDSSDTAHGKVLQIGDAENPTQNVVKNLSGINASKSGKWLVSYSAYMNTGSKLKTTMGVNSGEVTTGFMVGDDATVHHSYVWANNDNKFATATKNTWVKIECIFDLDNQKLTYTAKKEDGTVLGTKTVDFVASNGGGALNKVTELNKFTVYNDTGYTYVDNIKIEKYIAKPVLSNDSVQILDRDGNAVADYTAVDPALSSIRLDFDCELDKTSAEKYVKLTDGQGNTVDASVTAEADQRYVYIKPNNMLAGKTTYKVVAEKDNDGTVLNNNNDALASKFEKEFTTAAATDSIKLVEIDGVTKLSDITASSKFTVKTTAVNAQTTSKNLLWLAVFYKGDICKNVVPVTATINAMTASVNPPEFTAPADMTDIDSVKVFLWDESSSMIPYCAPLTVDANGVSWNN